MLQQVPAVPGFSMADSLNDCGRTYVTLHDRLCSERGPGRLSGATVSLPGGIGGGHLQADRRTDQPDDPRNPTDDRQGRRGGGVAHVVG
jgi:hypothetical protein